jgi:hypothetical protein
VAAVPEHHHDYIPAGRCGLLSLFLSLRGVTAGPEVLSYQPNRSVIPIPVDLGPDPAAVVGFCVPVIEFGVTCGFWTALEQVIP